MHPTRLYHETDTATLIARARAHPFALVCAVSGDKVSAVHAPIVVAEAAGKVSFRFHLTTTNKVTHALTSGSRTLIVFTGPNAYISPDWYGIEDKVPTWDYVSVEAEGPVTLLDDAGTAQVLDDLSHHFEAALAPKPEWTRAKMSTKRFDMLFRAIRGFEVIPTRFEGTTKLEQDKPQSARDGVIAALSMQEDGIAIANEMRKLQP
jgi:transcriptional regulator